MNEDTDLVWPVRTGGRPASLPAGAHGVPWSPPHFTYALSASESVAAAGSEFASDRSDVGFDYRGCRRAITGIKTARTVNTRGDRP
jgi:hypothetical protein